MRSSFLKIPVFLAVALSLLLIVACGTGGGGGGKAKATLTIQTFFETLDLPASSGIIIKINGVEEGVTESDGTFKVEIEAGTYVIKAYSPNLAGGSKTVELSAGADETLNIVMEGEGLVEPTQLAIDQFESGIQGNVLDQQFTALTLRFLTKTNETAVLSYLDDISIEPANGGPPVRLTQYFTLQTDGTIAATDIDSLRTALLAVGGEITVRVHGSDGQGQTHWDFIKFYLGRYTIEGTLAAPPSNPSLPVANVTVKATLLTLSGVNTVFETASNSEGAFTFTSIPIGTLALEATIESGGKTYSVNTTLPVNNDKTITLTLLTTEDIINGVPDLIVTSLNPTASITALSLERFEAQQKLQHKPVFQASAVGDTVMATVTATGGGKDTPVSDTATISVPAGTETVQLKYKVSSAEYPTYVKKQSQFDDVWQLKVTDESGLLLFAITSRVNAQLNHHPIWQSDGTTGEITEIIDMSGITTFDTTLTIVAVSTNIGDSALATTVTGSLSFESEFNIRVVLPDTVPNRLLNLSEYYSIPRQGESNFFHRNFILVLTGLPEDATIKNVVAEMFQTSNPDNFMTLVNQGVDGTIVQQLDKDSLQVRVTTGNPNLPTDPPPFHNMGYRFTVEADLNGEKLETPRKESGIRAALWRMPDIFHERRVGPTSNKKEDRDDGLDDWTVKGTYEWMLQHSTLITHINDVSGEHARDIGHTATHGHGTDIDMYHFTHLLGDTNPRVGLKNYLELAALTKEALDAVSCGIAGVCTAAQVQTKIDPVKNWFTEARTSLTALIDLDSVKRIIFAKGGKIATIPQLPLNWVKTLLQTGSLTDENGITLDLGIGSWNGAKMDYYFDHHDHVHLELDHTRLNNSP